MIDPMEPVEPVPPLPPGEQLAAELRRSMMWDMIGPYAIRDEPLKYGQHPASMDVIEAEAAEFWARKSTLLPLGMYFPMYCVIAAETACRAIIMGEGMLDKMTPEDLHNFHINNIRLASSVAESVVGHLFQRGLITYGENYELLGKQA
jgi:hypothetical protein